MMSRGLNVREALAGVKDSPTEPNCAKIIQNQRKKLFHSAEEVAILYKQAAPNGSALNRTPFAFYPGVRAVAGAGIFLRLPSRNDVSN